jgi:hypothetical protein
MLISSMSIISGASLHITFVLFKLDGICTDMANMLTINKQLGHSGGSSASFIISFVPKVVRKPDAYWIEMNHCRAANPRRNHEFLGNLLSLNSNLK